MHKQLQWASWTHIQGYISLVGGGWYQEHIGSCWHYNHLYHILRLALYTQCDVSKTGYSQQLDSKFSFNYREPRGKY